jgi:hypothetical protein
MTISDLERLVTRRRREASVLKRQRNQLQQKLNLLERKIVTLEGGKFRGGAVGGAGRIKNERSLVASMEMILSKTSKPMAVGDIVESVLKSGYRTSSENFRGIVNQTLIKEKKHFSSAGRGLYQLKK